MEGHQLERLPSTMTTWEQWRQLHPQTTVYVKPKAYYRRFATDHFEYIAQAASGPVQVDDLVLGLEGHAQARAYLLRRLAQQRLVQDTFEDAPILVYLSADLSTVRVFNREVEGQTLQFALTEDENLRDQETSSLWHPVTGESIQGPHKGKKLTGLIARYAVWFAWHSYRPDTHIHGE
jgi:hypothetical protein